MHRTLKDDTANHQQPLSVRSKAVDRFRRVFHNERPHEGLSNRLPQSLDRASSVRPPRNLPKYRYPAGLLLRRVNNSGDISWHKARIFSSEGFRFEELGLELVHPDFTVSLSAIWRSESWTPKNNAFMLRAAFDETAFAKSRPWK